MCYVEIYANTVIFRGSIGRYRLKAYLLESIAFNIRALQSMVAAYVNQSLLIMRRSGKLGYNEESQPATNETKRHFLFPLNYFALRRLSTY